MKNYTVLSKLNHNGQIYQMGDQVELDPKDDNTKSLLKDKIVSGDKIPVVIQKDWKQGPKSDIHTADKDEEVNADDESSKPEEGSDEDVDKTLQEEETENQMAGSKDDTGKIDKDADKDL